MGITGIWLHTAWGFRLGMAGYLIILTVLDQKLDFDRRRARMSWMRAMYGASLLDWRHSAPAAGQQPAGMGGSAAQHSGGQPPLLSGGLQHGSGQQPPCGGLAAAYSGGQHPLLGGGPIYGRQQAPFVAA
jgi:hypothetical protein